MKLDNTQEYQYDEPEVTMEVLSKEARLIEEVVRRVLLRYRENLHSEDYQRRALDLTIGELPGIVRESVQSLRMERARAKPHPGAGAFREEFKAKQ
jgi:hypothetical protein